MSTPVFDTLRKLGTELSPALIEGTLGLFAPLALQPTADFCTVVRDVAYGPDARHRMDIFYPAEAAAEPRPVIVFVHGGGFVRGDKGAPDAPFYNNVGAWAVRNGLIGVTMTYRLAPASQWPAGSEDVAMALESLHERVERFGGDPGRVFLSGQSAGAVHVAGHVAGHHGRSGGPRVAGAIMLSGIYDLLSLRHGPFEEAYFGTERTRFSEASSMQALARTDIPCLYTVSEWDPPTFQQQALRLVETHWAARGRLPRLLYQQGHNHLSPVLQLGSSFDTLGGELLAFIRRLT